MSESTEGASPKSTGDSLIEKLEAQVSQAVNPSMHTLGRNQGLVEAIAIVRRHYEGHPAVPEKPLEIQSRDELLAYIRHHQAEQPQDVVERVARAIMTWYRDTDCNSWDEASTRWKSECIEGAKTVLTALGDGSATIAPVSAETVQPITPASEFEFAWNEERTIVPYPDLRDMGDVSVQFVRNEISVPDENSRNRFPEIVIANRLIQQGCNEYKALDYARDAVEVLAPYFRQPSPQVDIEAGAIACSQWVYGANHGKPSWDRLTEEHREQYREQARACAAAWGLSWE